MAPAKGSDDPDDVVVPAVLGVLGVLGVETTVVVTAVGVVDDVSGVRFSVVGVGVSEDWAVVSSWVGDAVSLLSDWGIEIERLGRADVVPVPAPPVAELVGGADDVAAVLPATALPPTVDEHPAKRMRAAAAAMAA